MRNSVQRRALPLAATIVALALSAVNATAQSKRGITDDDLMKMKAVGGVAISPAGDRVLYTVTQWEHANARADTALGDMHDRRAHVWIVPFVGGAARQLTSSERGESQPQWSPDGSLIAFVSARDAGSADDPPKPQVWLLNADGGEGWQLTNARDGVVSFSFSPDSRRIAYVTPDTVSREQEAKLRRKDDPRVFEADFRLNHVWVTDLATKHAEKVTSGDFTVPGTPSWSPDGLKLAFDASPTPMIRDERRDAYVATISTHSIDRITTNSDVESTPQYSPDGHSLAFTILPHEWQPNTDGIMSRTLRNARLVTWDVATRKTSEHLMPALDVSAGQAHWNADGTHLWFTTSDRVYQNLYDFDLSKNIGVKTTHDLVVGGVSASRNGAKMAFTFDSPSWPAEVYVQDASLPSPKRITNTNAWLSDVALGESEVITWKSKDGSTVEGILLKPIGYTAGQKVPLLVSAAWRANWRSHERIQRWHESRSVVGRAWVGRVVSQSARQHRLRREVDARQHS